MFYGDLRYRHTASSVQTGQAPRALSPEVGKLAWMIKARRASIISPNRLRFPLQVKQRWQSEDRRSEDRAPSGERDRIRAKGDIRDFLEDGFVG